MSLQHHRGEHEICRHQLAAGGCALGGLCKFKHIEVGTLPHEDRKTTSASVEVDKEKTFVVDIQQEVLDERESFTRWFWKENAYNYSAAAESWRPFSVEFEEQLEETFIELRNKNKLATHFLLNGKYEVDFRSMSMRERMDGGARRYIQRVLCQVEPRWYISVADGTSTRMLGRRLSQILEYHYVCGARTHLTVTIAGKLIFFNLELLTAFDGEEIEAQYFTFTKRYEELGVPKAKMPLFEPKPQTLQRQSVRLRYGGKASDPYACPLLDDRALLESLATSVATGGGLHSPRTASVCSIGSSVTTTTPTPPSLLHCVDAVGRSTKTHRGLLPVHDPALLAIDDVLKEPKTICTHQACSVFSATSSHLWTHRHRCPFGRAGECWLAKMPGLRTELHNLLFIHDSPALKLMTEDLTMWRQQRTITKDFRRRWEGDPLTRTNSMLTPGVSLNLAARTSPTATSCSTPPKERGGSPLEKRLGTVSLGTTARTSPTQSCFAFAQSTQAVGPDGINYTTTASQQVEMHNIVLGSKEGQLVTSWMDEHFSFFNRYPRIQRVENAVQYDRYLRCRSELQMECYEEFGKEMLQNSDRVMFTVIEPSALQTILSSSKHMVELFEEPSRALEYTRHRLRKKKNKNKKTNHSGSSTPSDSTADVESTPFLLLGVIAFFGTHTTALRMTEEQYLHRAQAKPVDEDSYGEGEDDDDVEEEEAMRTSRQSRHYRFGSASNRDGVSQRVDEVLATQDVPPAPFPLLPSINRSRRWPNHVPHQAYDGSNALQVVPYQAIYDEYRLSYTLFSPDQWCPMYLITCQL